MLPVPRAPSDGAQTVDSWAVNASPVTINRALLIVYRAEKSHSTLGIALYTVLKIVLQYGKEIFAIQKSAASCCQRRTIWGIFCYCCHAIRKRLFIGILSRILTRHGTSFESLVILETK